MYDKDWFEVGEDGVVRIKNEAKEIPEIKTLSSRDKSKGKEQFQRECQYIWHLVSTRSPYENYGVESVREQEVIKDFIKLSNWKADEEIKKAVAKYRDSKETPSMRLLRAAKAAARNLAEFLESQIEGGFNESNVDQVSKLLEKVGKIVESLDKLEDKVKKEITNEEKIRGGGVSRGRER